MAEVKICGITTNEALEASIAAGASYAGFVFYDKSPRAIAPAKARKLVKAAKGRIQTVALMVNPAESFVEELLFDLPVDVIQLHGEETPAFCAWLRERHNVKICKSFPIESAKDFEWTYEYEEAIDLALFDAKPPKGADRPGGNAVAFDWQLVANYKAFCPWLLAGGLTPENVAEAIALTGAQIVDVSSGVEAERGVKDLQKIAAFGKAAGAGAAA